jgi:hypothetical protein
MGGPRQSVSKTVKDELFEPKAFYKDIYNTILWGRGMRGLLTQCWKGITAVIE